MSAKKAVISGAPHAVDVPVEENVDTSFRIAETLP